MPQKVYAKATQHFDAPAEAIYDSWLDPEKIRVWMSAALKSFGLSGEMIRVETDPKKGGRFFFSDLRHGTRAQHWGTYLQLARPSLIVFTWIVDASDEKSPPIVTLTIVPDEVKGGETKEGEASQDGGEEAEARPIGCTATLVHEMDSEWEEYVPRVAEGWSRMLEASAGIMAK